MKKLIKIPNNINYHLRCIILDYAVDNMNIYGDIDITTYEWYVSNTKTLKCDHIIQLFYDSVLMGALLYENLPLFKWVSFKFIEWNNLKNNINPYIIDQMVSWIFMGLGSSANVDMARFVAELYNLNNTQYLYHNYNISICTIINSAYKNNHRCVVDYIIKNFQISPEEINTICNIVSANNDTETYSYIYIRYLKVMLKYIPSPSIMDEID